MVEEPKKEVTLEDLVSEMVLKATAGVRAQYEQTIEKLEERTNETIHEVEKRLRAILSQMNSYVCYNCDKDLISGKDAIYTNRDGHKFCSHKCIDEKLNETR